MTYIKRFELGGKYKECTAGDNHNTDNMNKINLAMDLLEARESMKQVKGTQWIFETKDLYRVFRFIHSRGISTLELFGNLEDKVKHYMGAVMLESEVTQAELTDAGGLWYPNSSKNKHLNGEDTNSKSDLTSLTNTGTQLSPHKECVKSSKEEEAASSLVSMTTAKDEDMEKEEKEEEEITSQKDEIQRMNQKHPRTWKEVEKEAMELKKKLKPNARTIMKKPAPQTRTQISKKIQEVKNQPEMTQKMTDDDGSETDDIESLSS